MNKPFTYEQAEEICEDFEDLVDTELVIDGNKYFVDKLLIVPFNSEQEGYDVLFVASFTEDPNNTITQTIRDYITNNGVNYNFPE